MSYIVTTRQSAPACDGGWAGVRRAFATRNRLGTIGEPLPALTLDTPVPGVGQSISELRAIGYSDTKICQLIQEQIGGGGSVSTCIANIAKLSSAPRQIPSQGSSSTSAASWFNKESLVKGLKDGYVAIGAGLVLIMAAAGVRR